MTDQKCIDQKNRDIGRERADQEWAVEIEGLSYTYEENETRALDDVSLRIPKGSRTVFMGGNGSGKSTLFLCMNGILKPDCGTVRIGGSPVIYNKKGLLDVRRRVGIVFQEPDNQLFSASVYQEISFGILNLGVDHETARQEVERVIEELGITPFRDRPAHALSGGQKKQVAIADILVMSPEIMILDEPAASLDPRHTRIVEEIVERLTRSGITVLMATHDIDYAYAWADRMILMKDGKVLREGTPLEVCADREALEQTSLEQPSVLKLYDAMTGHGMMSREETPPASIDELIRRIGR